MKKYFNGQIVDMTEKDIAKSKERAKKRNNEQVNNSVYEKRIKDLEQLVEKLLASQAKPEQEQAPELEQEVKVEQ